MSFFDQLQKIGKSPSVKTAEHLAKTTVGPMVEQIALQVAAQGVALLMQWLEEWAAKGKTSLVATGTLTKEDELTIMKRQAFDRAKEMHPEIRDSVLNAAVEQAIMATKGNQPATVTPAAS